jgi:hypothetical protein
VFAVLSVSLPKWEGTMQDDEVIVTSIQIARMNHN